VKYSADRPLAFVEDNMHIHLFFSQNNYLKTPDLASTVHTTLIIDL